MSEKTLDGLSDGDSAVIERVGRGAAARRLMALGFVPGTTLTVVRRAPLGDPVEYELRGTRISIRRQDASTIQVRRAVT